MNKVTVLFFATLREHAGTKQIELELPEGTTVAELRAILAARLPGLAEPLRTSLAAINKQYAFDEELIPPGAEIAIFPPVSGGSAGPPTVFAVTEAELDLDDLLAQITLTGTGAACVFTGMVRGQTERGEPRETVYLEYEAYQPMAEAKMRQVADEIRARWPSVQGIAVVQRVGRLYPRTPTVLIACTAAHRDTGVFEAARYGIDRLKEIVPVWKKEVGPQGEAWIEGEYTPSRDD
ncbi:MAG: molybdopterin converting factor subunit 1 [Anaerolineales bacterium]|nr:molybdopterin converting factor subunit 1 [Anaerolineales bacterium]